MYRELSYIRRMALSLLALVGGAPSAIMGRSFCYRGHAMSSQPIGYVKLLRNNKAFRRLWYGQVVSQLGDWFDSIALFALLLRLTGSGQAVGVLMVAQFLPSTIVGLFAGVVVDRLPRKLVMIVTNLGNAPLVLL